MNNKYKIILFLVLLVTVVLPVSSFCDEEVQADNETNKFTRRECRRAVKWINNDLSLLMGSGILKRIVAKKNFYNVYAGEAWGELEFEQRGEILKNLSRSREIMGHSPFLKIFDHDSGKAVAAVSKKKIEIQFKDEGFFQYIPQGKKPEQTFY